MKDRMKRQITSLAALILLAGSGVAATPPPDQLLASDTLAVFTIPEYAKAKATWSQWPGALLWADPSVKPFKDKLLAKVKTDLFEPLEKQFGLRFADYSGLAQGQVTLALTQNGWGKTPGAEPAFLLLIDTRDKGGALKSNLASLKQKWVDSGKQIKTETIRNVEFTTLIFNTDDLSKAIDKVFPDPSAGYETAEAPKPKKPGKKVEWLIGQSESLLILGSAATDIEKILIRQTGGAVPTLAEQPAFAKDYARQMRDSLTYGWINFKTFFEVLVKQFGEKPGAENPNRNPAAPQPDKILGALGVNGLTTLSFGLREVPEGIAVQAFLGAPEANRRGLTKLITFEAKDSSPPPFVPADAVKFSRLRLDLQKTWATLENMLVEAAPQFAGVIKLLMDNAGKDKDPNFDLRAQLIGNLGDDIVTFEKSPRRQTLADLNSPPSLALISSPKADQLASALKALASLMPQQSAKVKEREFLGRKVYTMGLPPMSPPGGGRPVERSLHFAGSGGYVAISTDVAMLEEYLRSSAGSGKSLRDNPIVAQAADKVSGMNTGLFGYENQAETTRAALEILKKESGTIANLFSGTPLAGRLGIGEGNSKFKDWVDFSLLPSFDKIAKYFYISVWSGNLTAEGIGLRVFSPTPPGLRK